ncbi:hypothetical protein RHSIM_Rhsim01G0011300 [Rhododendron simsii]|uniref:Mannosyltransferase n=1 Tax=Rhododendron simsii TaxID=118357 RepID=A0A834HHX8_RHOSS|nr:hypothetical protein RHSIM_Rhsim01G0011300 [Rhododendron simsii]
MEKKTQIWVVVIASFEQTIQVIEQATVSWRGRHSHARSRGVVLRFLSRAIGHPVVFWRGMYSCGDEGFCSYSLMAAAMSLFFTRPRLISVIHCGDDDPDLLATAENAAISVGWMSDLYAHAAVDNEAAKNMYMKSGFVYESDEPALKTRYGHLAWEWEQWIRSYLHPMMFACLYKVLALFHLDTPLFMIKAPRMLQSMISAVGDLYLCKLSHVLFGGHAAQWAVSF